MPPTCVSATLCLPPKGKEVSVGKLEQTPIPLRPKLHSVRLACLRTTYTTLLLLLYKVTTVGSWPISLVKVGKVQLPATPLTRRRTKSGWLKVDIYKYLPFPKILISTRPIGKSFVGNPNRPNAWLGRTRKVTKLRLAAN